MKFAYVRLDPLGNQMCGNKHAGFVNGVIYTDGKNKGDYVEDFLKLTKYTPSQIIMTDDKSQNLIDVQTYVNNKAIPMTAYEMTGAKHLK